MNTMLSNRKPAFMIFIVVLFLQPIYAQFADEYIKRSYHWKHFDQKEYTCEFIVPEIDITQSYEELGLIDEEMTLKLLNFSFHGTYRTEEEKLRLDRQIRLEKKRWEEECDRRRNEYYKNLKNHGFLIEGDNIVLDYRGLYQKNLYRMEKYSNKLLQIATRHHLNEWEFCKFLLSFVQEIHYTVPQNYREEYYTGGLYTPPEALMRGEGDCDSKSLLISTLIGNRGTTEVILLDGPKHVLVGIEGNPRHGEYYIEFKNKKFVLCEVSKGVWMPGRIAQEIMLEFQKGKYRYIELE